MGTNRKRVTRKVYDLKDYERAFLQDESGEKLGKWGRYQLWSMKHGGSGFGGMRGPKELWTEYGAEFLAEYVREHPGRRPVGWWLFDAPRQPDRGTGWFFEGTLMEPRRQLSGKGSTPWDAGLAVVPWFSYGLPCSWEGYDPEDPPKFESQAAYLERHGLLSDGEKKILAKKPEAWTPEPVTFFEGDDDNDESETS